MSEVKKLTRSEFSDLVGLIYSSIEDTQSWSVFLEKITALFGAVGANIVYSDIHNNKLLLSYQHPFDERTVDRLEEYLFKDPALPAFLSFNGKVVSERTVLDYEEFLTSEASSEFLQPLGIYERIGFVRDDGSGRLLAMVVLMGKDRTPQVEGAFELISELQPHILRAMDIRRKCVESNYKNTILLKALNDIPLGVVFVDGDCSVIFRNYTANRILNENTSISIVRDKLRFSDRATEKSVHALVRSLDGEAAHADSENVFRLDKASGSSKLLMVVNRIGSRNNELFQEGLARPAAVLYISDPDIRQETSENLLGRLFGLTASEARVLSLLVQGIRTREISEQLGLTAETVRGYIKNILSKTDCHSQAELVKLVASSPAWIRNRNQVAPT